MSRRFTVSWHDDAEIRLSEMWMSAVDRPAVQRAADAIDEALAKDPKRFGVEIAEGLYRIVEPPLRVYFEISDADRRVHVAHISWSVGFSS